MKALVVWLMITTVAFAAGPELRQWTAQSGAKVQAKFVEQKENDVVLESADGKKFAIRFDKLSAADQEYIRGLTKPAAPAAPAAPAPAGAVAVDPGGKWKAGEISGDIQCKKDAQWTYLLYVPKSFDPKRKWPVLFLVTDGGASANELKFFVPGAEFCGWIVAASRQARAKFFDSETAFQTTVEDVLSKLPVDPQRMYAGGFLNSCPLVIGLAGQRKDPALAGLLLISGAQPEVQKVPGTTASYGLCGTNCGNRGQMVQAFRDLRSANNHLRFFAGENEWPTVELIRDGMVWLNYATLSTAPQSEQALAREKKAFGQKMEDEITQLKDNDPERAYEWTEALAGPGGAGKPVNQQFSALLNNPKVKLYMAGQNELQRLLKKYFRGKTVGNDLGKDGDADAKKLATTYKDCSFGEVFERLQRGATPAN